MWYAIYSEDKPGSLKKRMGARPAHLARLQTLNDENRLLIAGPNPISDTQDLGFSGSTVIAQFDSLDDAKAWADADPYMDAGVYQRVTVKPFKKVLPE